MFLPLWIPHTFASEFNLKIICEMKYLIKTKKPQRAVTPGQSLVLYKKRLYNKYEVLGGGIIR